MVKMAQASSRPSTPTSAGSSSSSSSEITVDASQKNGFLCPNHYDPNPNSLMPPPPIPQQQPAKTTHICSPKPERRPLSMAKEEQRKSFIKECPPQAFKSYMDQHIEKIWIEYGQRESRKQQLNEALMNADEANINGGFNKDDFKAAMQKIETNFLRTKRAKLGKNDFTTIKRIGNGAYGVVNLVRKKNEISHPNSHTGPIDLNKKKFSGLYAMKTLQKSRIFHTFQQAHVIA